jgi:hypothetical protein
MQMALFITSSKWGQVSLYSKQTLVLFKEADKTSTSDDTKYNDQMQANSEHCPRCDAMGLKSWEDLTGDEKLLADRLPASAEYTPEERKKHRFCTRCWYEEVKKSKDLA